MHLKNISVTLILLLMYKLKGFILSVTIVSLLDFNNMGLGSPTAWAYWTLSLARRGLFSFIKIQARARPGHPAHAGL